MRFPSGHTYSYTFKSPSVRALEVLEHGTFRQFIRRNLSTKHPFRDHAMKSNFIFETVASRGGADRTG